MVRGPRPGNGTWSSVHYLGSAGLAPPRALGDRMDLPAAGLLPDGSMAAEPGRSVPVASTGQGNGIMVCGERSWLPAPPQISPPAAPCGTGRVAQSQPMNEPPAFCPAYAGCDSAALNEFPGRAARVTGLGGARAFDSISAPHVPPGGNSQQITVTGIWQLREHPGSVTGNLGVTQKLRMRGMSVLDLHNGKWYVKEIGASTETVGAR
jgi:hypothetical protein